ncbi:MFS transporter [Clostridium estertheticum]|uniref:MFS transporter n=1 Tax=Clostridium estertheticum TaxID=238834 RepID=UPI001C7D43F6|nr:MFS transporter [Clostridium estertheticum]MBX4267891.1 MFS transporter [Clostridium estertheticum]WLC78122.1 MFS transporter [Clostridium estertheticum]
MKKLKLTKFNVFAMLLIPFVWIYELSVVAPILGSIGAAFPSASTFQLQLIVIIPFFASIPMSVVAGKLAKRYDKRNIIILGLLIYGITGMLPFLAQTMNQILICRLVTGVGVGLVLPLPNAMIAEHFEGTKRQRMLGLATSVANIANVLDSIAVGFILLLGWRYPFLCFSIPLVIMVVAIFGLPKSDPKKKPVVIEEDHMGTNGIPKIAWALVAFMAVNWLFFAFNITNMALFMVKEKIGLPWMIGIAICFPGLACILSGAIFPEFYKKTKKYLVTISLAFFAVGYIVMYLTHSFATQTLANLLIGFGSGMLTPYILNLTSQKVGATHRDAAYGLVTSGIHIGYLIAPFAQLAILAISGNGTPRFLFGFSALMLIIATIVTLFIAIKKPNQIVADIEETSALKI